MRKRDIFLSVLVLILIAMIPWFDGWLVKENYLALISNLNTINQQSKIKVVDYSLGWLGSAVTLHIEPIDSKKNINDKKATSAFTTVIEQNISHGPYLYDDTKKQWTFALAEIQSDVTFPSLWSSFLVKQKSDKSDVHIDTLVNFSQDLINHVIVPTFSIKPMLGATKIVFSGMTADVDASIEGHQITSVTVSEVLNPIIINTDVSNVSFNGIKVKYNANYQDIGIWNGSAEVDIPVILVSNINGLSLELKNLKMDSRFGVDNYNLYNISAKALLNNGAISDLFIMPSSITLSVENLNSKGLIKLFPLLPQQIEKINKVLPETINMTTSINEIVNINTSLGRVFSSGTVFWPKNSNLPQSINDIQASYNMKIDIRASISLVNKWIEFIFGASSQHDSHEPLNQLMISQPTEQTLLDQVDRWKGKNSIALDVSYQLKDLIKRKLSFAIFAGNIDRYVIRKDLTEDLAAQLKAAYMTLYPDPKNKITPVATIALPPSVIQQQSTPADLAHNQIDNWIKQGIIKKDKDEYTISIVRK